MTPLQLLASITATNTYRAPLSDYVSLRHLQEFGWDKYSSFAVSWCLFSEFSKIPEPFENRSKFTVEM